MDSALGRVGEMLFPEFFQTREGDQRADRDVPHRFLLGFWR